MQVITVGNTAQDLCDKLASAAETTFFDSVEMASGSSSIVECKKNGVTVMKIELNGTVNVAFPDGVYNQFTRSQSYVDYIDLIVVTSKAIYFRNYYGNGASVIISKDINGDLTFVTCVYNNVIVSINGTAKTSPISVYKENANVITRNYAFNNDNTTKKSYFIPTFVNDAEFVDGVYVSLVRPYPDEPGYMPFTIGSAQYVGFDGTSFIVKA